MIRETAEIEGYRAQIYFDASTREIAEALREFTTTSARATRCSGVACPIST
jgi:aromatic ring-cleaving dioxygenase